MKRLRFDLYSGFADNRSFTEKDRWIQCEGETLEDIAQAVYQAVLDNAEALLNDEGDEEDE